uniref:Uncharacterized protein n=1 Tax=Anguilla anguilla TaxID=7936 RepID=A0A0E9X3Q0_ANGAN
METKMVCEKTRTFSQIFISKEYVSADKPKAIWRTKIPTATFQKSITILVLKYTGTIYIQEIIDIYAKLTQQGP